MIPTEFFSGAAALLTLSSLKNTVKETVEKGKELLIPVGDRFLGSGPVGDDLWYHIGGYAPLYCFRHLPPGIRVDRWTVELELSLFTYTKLVRQG